MSMLLAVFSALLFLGILIIVALFWSNIGRNDDFEGFDNYDD